MMTLMKQGDIIVPKDETDRYKYLGILKSRQFEHTKLKKQLTT
jgi:hypothetical protein